MGSRKDREKRQRAFEVCSDLVDYYQSETTPFDASRRGDAEDIERYIKYREIVRKNQTANRVYMSYHEDYVTILEMFTNKNEEDKGE